MKMMRGKNIFNIGRFAKFDYEMLINNVKNYSKYKTMPLSKLFAS